MALIAIDQLELGMTLAEDVRDISSRLLLSKGLKILEKHIRILKMWGIFEVHIEGADLPGTQIPPISANPERLNMVGQNMIKLFRHLDIEHPAIQEVMKFTIPYQADRPTQAETTRHARTDRQLDPTAPPKDVISKLERIDVTLPEVPSLVFELNEIIANPLSSAADIAQLVNQSPSLAAMLLKIVNSAFYGFRSKIDSISRAVVMIGSKEVSNLALGIVIMEKFKDIPKHIMNVESFMEHNLACGIVARILSAHGHVAGSEQHFVSGMLHDIGRLIICKYFPQIASAMVNLSRQADETLLKAERHLAGTTHTQIGKKLIQKWKLPYTLENNVQYHHNPSGSPEPESAAVVQMADIIVHGLGFGGSGEHIVPGFDASAWNRLKLPAGALPSVIQQAIHQIDNFRRAFSGT